MKYLITGYVFLSPLAFIACHYPPASIYGYVYFGTGAFALWCILCAGLLAYLSPADETWYSSNVFGPWNVESLERAMLHGKWCIAWNSKDPKMRTIARVGSFDSVTYDRFILAPWE